MMTFLLSAGAMIIVLLLIICIPLLTFRKKDTGAEELPQANIAIYRDQFKELEDELARGAISQNEYDESRLELERRVIEESVPEKQVEPTSQKAGVYTVFVLVLVVPFFAVAMWAATQHLGDFRLDGGANEGVVDYNTGTVVRQAGEMHDMDSALKKLREHLRETPGDIQGWMMLGRTMLTMKNYKEAEAAFTKADQLAPGNPAIMVDLADAIAMVQGQDLSGKPWELVQKALKIDPTNWKALMMGGTDYFNRGDYRHAVMYWERLLGTLSANDDMRAAVIGSIQEARKLGNIVGPVQDTLDFGKPADNKDERAVPMMSQMMKNGSAPMGQTPVPAQAMKATHFISGVVELDPKLEEQAAKFDTLYVTARPASGSRAPIAQLKIKVLSFPVHFKLDNTMLPPMDMGGGTLDEHENVMITARLGNSQQMMPANGDLEGQTSNAVKVGADDITLKLTNVIAR